MERCFDRYVTPEVFLNRLKNSAVRKANFWWILIVVTVLLSSCLDEFEYSYLPSRQVEHNYRTEHVFIVVADGLRYSEGWPESPENMPYISGVLAKEGVVGTNFFNLGDTYTSAGHTSLTTGFYQAIDNAGLEFPRNPSIFQFWNQVYRYEGVKSWIIASKDKLDLLANCANPYWSSKYTPSANTGIDGRGLGSGYREDSLTLKEAFSIVKTYHPSMVLINFRDPDYSAHSGDWKQYIAAINRTDQYIYRLWNFLQTDSMYRNRTTLWVTSDHGRHLDSVADGFVGHGDGCAGCRHLCFLALGPDFFRGKIVKSERSLIDIPATVAALMGFELPGSNGKVMTELFNRQ